MSKVIESIFFKSGSASFFANLFLILIQTWLITSVEGKNFSLIPTFCLPIYSFNIAMVEAGSFSTLPDPPLAVCGETNPLSKSKFFKQLLANSTGRNPVSRKILKTREYFFPEVPVPLFNCSVVGTFGNLSGYYRMAFSMLTHSIQHNDHMR